MSSALVSICPSGFKLKHFLRDNETLSSFLRRNASFPEDAIQHIREADINLGKVCGLPSLHTVDTRPLKPQFQRNTSDFCLLPTTSDPTRRFWSSPKGHVSQEGGAADTGGLCDDLRSTDICAGAGSTVSRPSRLVKPCRRTLPAEPGLLQAHPGKIIPDFKV